VRGVLLAVSFAHPGRLWFLLAVVALVAVYVFLQWRRRSTYAVRFTNLALLDVVAPKRPGWRRHVTAAAFAVGTATLVAALAEPTTEVEVPVERATVVLAIDVSLSMEATDVLPSRLDAAKAAAGAFLDTVPENLNVGLVEFAGAANVIVPPTTDHGDLDRAIDDLTLGEGTGIGEAIFTSLAALDTLPEADDPDEKVPATIIVLSDGETTVGRSNDEGVQAAIEAEVPVSTIAFGTADGLIFIEGQPVAVPPDLDAMEAIAEQTGGVFFEAESERELAAAYEDLGTSIGFETEQRPITEWFIGAALAALLVAAALSLLWFARLP
jgi:Ca-activated chloride channel family protein